MRGGGGLCVSLLGCTCVAEPRRERLGDTRKPGVAVGRQFPTEAGWLRATGTRVTGGAGRGKLLVEHPETLSLKLGSLGCPRLSV